MKKVLTNNRTILIICLDSIAIVLSYCLAFLIGFPGREPPEVYDMFFYTLPLIFIARFIFFYLFRLYKSSWRYASIVDLLSIFKAVGFSQIAIILGMVFFIRLGNFPRRILIIDPLILFMILGSMRFGVRLFREFGKGLFANYIERKILIVGAGDTGAMIARELKIKKDIIGYPVAFVDDDPRKQAIRIHGTPVVGKIDDISEVIKKHNIDEVIIAIPTASKNIIEKIIEKSEKTGTIVKTVPNLRDIINGKISLKHIREIRIEDLLGREKVEIDIQNISQYLTGKTILITGAGGTIGKEICRQITRFNPTKLILLGKGENSIKDTYEEIKSLNSDTKIYQLVGSVTNKRKLGAVFAQYSPDIVFHAGAHKHVDLMETNCDEAILTNILGTKNVIECSKQTGVKRAIIISTDKAADPVSIMGCTKRIAEMLIQAEDDVQTTLIGVRFGNVLGSRGSVVPLFAKQIRQGGPVTVTDPRMTRYFMTIPEAVELVIEAGAMGKHRDIFMLDMGRPVKILDLAKDMIKLSGFRYKEDIDIEFVGIRPGEKLQETLVGKNEQLIRTEHPKIFLLKFDGAEKDKLMLYSEVDNLIADAINMNFSIIKEKLKQIVPEYSAAEYYETVRV